MNHHLDIVAYQFDGRGGSKPISLDELALAERGNNEFAFAWVHLFRDSPAARQAHLAA